MNGVHDMGGMHGFGPVEREENEPVFHEAWEGRAIALQLLNALRDRDLVTDLARELMEQPREGQRVDDLAIALSVARVRLVECGDRATGEKAAVELDALADRTGDLSVRLLAMATPYYFAFVDGQLLEAARHIEQIRTFGVEYGMGTALDADGVLGFSAAVTLAYIDRGDEALSHVKGGSRATRSARAFLAAFLGRFDEARSARDSFDSLASDEDETHYGMLTSLFASALLSGDEDFVRGLRPRFLPYADQIMSAFSVARLLAEAASLLGEAEEARSYYLRGLQICKRVTFRPEIALIRLDLAELLLQHYPDEHDAAIEHLDFAIAELRDMKMQPALERALRHRGLLKA